MQSEDRVCFAPILNEAEKRLIECYRRCNDAGRQQLVIFAELFSTVGEPPPDNVIPFPQ